MKKSRALSILICLALLGLEQAMPQSPANTPLPRVIWITREDVKPARGKTHEQVEHGFAQFWAKAKCQPFLGLEAISGNATEAMFISGYDSFALFEKDFQAFDKASSGPMKPEYDAFSRQEAELINGVRSTVAIYRQDLSYLGDRLMGGLPKARYMDIMTTRVRPGKDESFAAGMKMYRSAYEKMKLEEPFATYQVILGAPEGTYLIFVPLKSLKDLDDYMAIEPKLMEAMGEENVKNMMKGAGEVFLATESNIYSFNPQISYVSKEFAAVDPEFWAPQPKAGPKPAAGEKKPIK
jgi:hypothetical protein